MGHPPPGDLTALCAPRRGNQRRDGYPAPLETGASRDHPRKYQEQIGVAGLLPGSGDEGVRLAAVMRLVVEEMGDEEPLRRADFASGGAAEPYQVLAEPGVVDRPGPTRDAGIALLARGA